MEFIVYNESTGDILRTGMCSDNNILLQAQEGESVIEGVANINNQYILNNEVTDYTPEQLTLKANIPYGYKWDIATMSAVKIFTDEQILDYLSAQARTKRDQLLNNSIIWSDTSYTGDVLASWLAYREVLKNITSQAGFPGSIVWPTKPA